MSSYDDGATDTISRAEFEQLRSELEATRAGGNPSPEELALVEQINNASSQEEIVAVIRQANIAALESRFGADAAEGVDI